VCSSDLSVANPRGLLAALADPRLSKALAAIHERPGDGWTIQSMAQVAGMSRTAFAERFHETLGQPPIQYLSNWRASEAKRLLRNRRFSVAAIAQQLGYRSEAAFRRFFKRMEGVGPGRVRAKSGDPDGEF
jgi:AraC-like DNA-binding protein